MDAPKLYNYNFGMQLPTAAWRKVSKAPNRQCMSLFVPVQKVYFYFEHCGSGRSNHLSGRYRERDYRKPSEGSTESAKTSALGLARIAGAQLSDN